MFVGGGKGMALWCLFGGRIAMKWLMENGRKFWALVASVVVATAGTIIFFLSAIDGHETKEHRALYKPRYPGDSVSRVIAELKDYTDNSMREEASDSEKRFAKIDVKLDNILTAVNNLTTDVAVLKVTR